MDKSPLRFSILCYSKIIEWLNSNKDCDDYLFMHSGFYRFGNDSVFVLFLLFY